MKPATTASLSRWARLLGASSQSLEEAFLTEIRVRLAERKARQFVSQTPVREHRSKLKAIEKQ